MGVARVGLASVVAKACWPITPLAANPAGADSIPFAHRHSSARAFKNRTSSGLPGSILKVLDSDLDLQARRIPGPTRVSAHSLTHWCSLGCGIGFDRSSLVVLKETEV
jgi:hypothetical protein